MQADLNFHVSEDGVFLLLIASAKGFIDMIHLMFQNKSLDMNKTDNYGVNAFWIACFYEKLDVMRLLVQRGIDISAKNQNGSNVLHIAVKKNSVEVVKELLRFNFPVDEPKNNGVNAVGIAAYKGNV